jgi:pyrroline-5-carboxylate reductase
VKIALIGCGGLGTSLALGLLRSNTAGLELRLCDHHQSKMNLIASEFPLLKIVTSLFAKNVAKGAEIVIVAVKPKDVERTLLQLKDDLGAQALLVSCAAGIQTQFIEKVIGKKCSVARAMPNTAVAVAGGIVGIFLGTNCDVQRDEERMNHIFGVLGAVRAVYAEESLHVVTALSGCGPAFALLFLEALVDAGVRSGLSRSEADFFAKGALRSASVLVDHVGLPPSELRAQITSPGGVTAEGVYQLERLSFRHAIMEAVDASKKKSEQINYTEQP